jgi:hypothetical protein
MRARLTYANVVSTLCLFILLGGGAYAAGTIDGADLKARSVPATKIKRDALTGAEIKESTLPFLRASRVASGLGALTTTVADTLITSPTIGLKVTTDGDADTAWTLRFINQSSDRLLVSRSSGPLAGLEAGASATLDSTSSVETFVIRSQEDQAKAVMLICGFETFTDTVTCAGLATA